MRVFVATSLTLLGLAGAFWTVTGEVTPTYWLQFWISLLLACFAAGQGGRSRLGQLLLPAAVPLVLLLLWQGLVIGFGVPKGIFPSVTDVWASLLATLPVLARDAYITFVKEILLGFIIGFAAGVVAGIAIAGSVFLQRGFLPLAAAFGAVPIVGLAPVLGRAFGVGWESKAAVVVIVTFFPVLLNTVQGLLSVDVLKLELLRAYAAKPWEVFVKLRLPNAAPYLFNALRLAVVLSIVSVIVAEFLIPGPPEGLGQRISLSARRGAYDVVFAAIFVSSLVSISVYNVVAWAERRTTRWQASAGED